MIRWRYALAVAMLLGLMGTQFVPVAAQSDGVTVYLRPVDAETDASITDACFVLQDFSNEGCDENGDGEIRYQGIPAGSYVVVQTVKADGYVSMMPLDIRVRESPAEQVFRIELTPEGAGDAVEVHLLPTDVTTGDPITDSCFVLADFSNEGCDENQDGTIRFEGVPAGVYTVVQTQESAGYLPVGEHNLIINLHDPVQRFRINMTPVRGDEGTVDISVVPYDASTGGGLTGACVIFEGASLEGCDDNGDGKITFEGVPVGSYLLTETVPPPGYSLAKARFVSVQQSGRTYYMEHFPDDSATRTESVDVALVTRHPETGDLLPGACYIILDASIEGCDENGDGQVDYDDVTPGTYTVHQSNAPDGFNGIQDFEIQISEFDPEQSVLIKQSLRQYEPGFRNVSVAVFDRDTGQRVKGPDICVVLVDFSNEGCDINSDGQIDFQDVPVGEYVIDATSLPDGYQVHFEDNLVIVEESNPFSIANALLVIEES